MEEISEPNDIEFFIGLPKTFDSSRLARLISSSQEDGLPQNNDQQIPERPSSKLPPVSGKKIHFDTLPIPTEINEDELLPRISKSFTVIKRFSPWKTRFVELPSGIGFGNARALSKAFCLLACSAKSDNNLENRMISHRVAQNALEMSVNGFDLTSLSKRALTRSGYFLSEEYPQAFYHYGNGGALVWGDYKYGIGLSYTPSHLLGASNHEHGTRAEKLVKAVYYCLRMLETQKPEAKL